MDGTHDNTEPKVQGNLDKHGPDRESGEGEGSDRMGATRSRAKRIQFDLSLSTGFNQPFAHITCFEDEYGICYWSVWSWITNELMAEFEVQPGGELDELREVLDRIITE